MVILKSLVFLVVCVTVAYSISCYTCDNDSCNRPQGYAQENCGDQITKCYTLKNVNNQIYRVGCLPINCDVINRQQNEQCIPCDSNNCNGFFLRDAPIGSGVTFNSAQTSITSLNAIFFATISSIVAFIFA